ncbi:MAG TPA: serine hydrolase domain-containing protein, partial [Roseiflexaceae bacterium]|nr:serine hydrolase domain-containing protein [Roseiflexaceae bacterium]
METSTSPEDVGIDSQRLRHAFTLLQQWLDSGMVGAVGALVMRRGMIAGEYYGGRIAPGQAAMVDRTSLFHLASIGKPMAALGVMLLVEQGSVTLDEPVAHILPAFAGQGRDGISVRQLLCHTSGLAEDPDLSGVPAGSDTADELRTYVAALPVVPIGSKVEYSNVGYGLLGLIIEAVSGMPFATYMHERLFAPADMSHAYLAPAEALYPRIVHVAGTPEPGGPYERFNSAHARRQTHPAGNIVG